MNNLTHKYLRWPARRIRAFARKLGFDISYYNPKTFGTNPFEDMKYFLGKQERPVIIDVGANVGQSVDSFVAAFPKAFIHSFEPSPATFQKLAKHCEGLSGVKTWNCGVGSSQGTLSLLENQAPEMSSFLEPGAFAWGTVEKATKVEVLTLDSFAKGHGIEFISILKSDTQGYDFEVLKGAEQLMKENRIGLIYLEFIFSDMYKELPSFPDLFRFLLDRNFSLVTFYQPSFQRDLLSWTELLFINRNFYNQGDH